MTQRAHPHKLEPPRNEHAPWRLALRGLLHALLHSVLLVSGALAAAPASSLDWQVLTGPETPAQTEFVRALTLARTDSEKSDDDAVNAGTRTRGLRPPTQTQNADHLVIAVGPEAARTALEQGGSAPLLMAMLSRTEHESLRALVALQGGSRRIGVLLRGPAPSSQLDLIDALLPGRKRVGVVVTASSEPMLRELQRAIASDARGWSLQVEQASDPLALSGALRAVLPRSDALIVLPDVIGESQPATLAILHAAASARVPVFGSGEGIVRSGALGALMSTPTQLAQQAVVMAERLAAGGAGTASSTTAATPASDAPMVQSAAAVTVRINPTVARSLDLRLPSEQELGRRLGLPLPAPEKGS